MIMITPKILAKILKILKETSPTSDANFPKPVLTWFPILS